MLDQMLPSVIVTAHSPLFYVVVVLGIFGGALWGLKLKEWLTNTTDAGALMFAMGALGLAVYALQVVF